MKVKELIEQLQKLDPEQTVLAICEDEDIVRKGQGVETFWVDSASVVRAESSRVDVGEVRFKFGEFPETRDHVFLQLEHKF
ncbi:hypothetical protein [Acinetobacter gerneri]|uniref:hypothetical protein n=1 Tax=Acinetobacter gerneri TaxID=202952 RepID=UPI0028ACAE5C|nr:hypothetical protein [Acinetobacter gerneri]